MVGRQLDELEVPWVAFNQRRFAEMDMGFGIFDGSVSGWLRIGRASYRLEDVRGVYSRIMDDTHLPELRGEPPGSPRRQACRALHEALVRWYDVSPARVVNRSGPMGSNSSKPYQAQLVQEQGFAVPETLVTNDPELVRDMKDRHGKLVYKSVSGVRSIVQTLEDEDWPRLERIRWCPVQFQVYVEGTNVRVHVVDREVFATAVKTTATDYRYADREFGAETELSPFELPCEVADRCIRVARALDLPFAGIDLMQTPEGDFVCLEVNPSPAFSYYQANTGQPIARAVARYLAGLGEEG